MLRSTGKSDSQDLSLISAQLLSSLFAEVRLYLPDKKLDRQFVASMFAASVRMRMQKTRSIRLFLHPMANTCQLS